MLFNSLEFAVFFPVVAALYFLLPFAMRTPLLLVASCVFYMAFIPAYILILLVLILIDYFAGIYLERVTGKGRRWLLIGSILATCAVLFVFKYYGFFTGSFNSVTGWLGYPLSWPTLHIILPIGLSFHTFQSLSYVIEVYNGRQKAEKNFITYATYVMFFPQLVAGPIERPQNLLGQFREEHTFDYDRITSGLKRMAWGFFKKLVIADRLALYVNDVYDSPENFNGLQLTIATVFFAYQIYCDFSGYSDIAIGSARVLGFRLMENFNTPYYSQSVAEFWRRWHISLSTWFRDYVYRPMGGNRVSKPRHCLNLLTTFAVSGLWHGANWTYVVWGLLNGIYFIFGSFTEPIRTRLFRLVGLSQTNPLRVAIRIACTFALVCGAWVVFRANTLSDAGYIFTHLGANWDFGVVTTRQFNLKHFPIAILGIVIVELIQALQRTKPITMRISALPGSIRWATYLALMITVMLLGVFRDGEFIYFQF